LKNILIVEANQKIQGILDEGGFDRVCRIERALNTDEAKKMMAQRKYSLVITEDRPPQITGIEVIHSAQEYDPPPRVIFFARDGKEKARAEALEAGAEGFIPGMSSKDKLINRVNELIGPAVQEKMTGSPDLPNMESKTGMKVPEIIGEDISSRQVLERIKKVAPTDATVLLQGESGTGKELYAKAIHLLSTRKDGPFMAINCAAIPGTLIENELFGHEKGAYTDAVSRKAGKFEIVHGGTIFLDEIAELDLSVQAKILRVLQEKEIEPLGGEKPLPVDVRIICATNKNIKQEMRNEKFRSDLYFRISVFPIFIEPLRRRNKDIPILANHYLKRFSKNMLKENLQFSEDSMKLLESYPWPGNVRELEHCIERAVIMVDGGTLLPEHLNIQIEETVEPDESTGFQDLIALDRPLEECRKAAVAWAEKFCLKSALKDARGDMDKAAEKMGISEEALIRLMKKHE